MPIKTDNEGNIIDTDAAWMEVIKEDFQTMHGFLDIIRERIAGADPATHRTFYAPLRDIIFYAYEDATKFSQDQDKGLASDLMDAFINPKDDE